MMKERDVLDLNLVALVIEQLEADSVGTITYYNQCAEWGQEVPAEVKVAVSVYKGVTLDEAIKKYGLTSTAAV